MKAVEKYKKSTRQKAFTSINITPLTDIALVLLIIFMIATPMLIQSKLDIKLPEVETKNREIPDQNLVIYIDSQGRIFIDYKMVSLIDLKVYIRGFANESLDKPVTINGDKDVKYNDIIQYIFRKFY